MEVKNSISINSNPIFSISNPIDKIDPLESAFSQIYNEKYIDTTSGPTVKITLGSLEDGLKIESISATYAFAPGVSSESALSKLQSSLNVSDTYADSTTSTQSDKTNVGTTNEGKVEIIINPAQGTSSSSTSNSVDLSPSKVKYAGSTGDVYDKSKPKPSKDQIYEWIDKYSTKYGVDPSLIKAMVRAESDFNHQVISRSGAVGLIQLMPETAKEMGLVVNDEIDERWNPEKNLEAGIKYISKYHKIISKHFGYENWDYTIAGYNAGPNRVMRNGGIPNIKETQSYVKKVNKYWNEYK